MQLTEDRPSFQLPQQSQQMADRRTDVHAYSGRQVQQAESTQSQTLRAESTATDTTLLDAQAGKPRQSAY